MNVSWEYPLLGVVGLIAGFVDSIAGGGGLITLPALLWAGLPPQLALGTNKLQSSFGTALAVTRYYQAGLMRVKGIGTGVAITFVASLAGSATVSHASPDVLRRVNPFLLIAIALYVGFKPALGSTQRTPKTAAAMFALVFGTVLGFYDGFFGPGTGSFWLTACVLLLGLDFRAATGYSKAMNLASNLASLLFFATKGQVNYGYGAVMVVGQLAGAELGSRVVIQKGSRLVRPMLLGVVAILASKLIWDAYFRG